MVELLCDQIETTMGHCDLFQWLKKILTSLRVTPITVSLSVRDQIKLCFKSAPLELSVQWELHCSKIHEKSPVHTILQIVGNVLKKFGKVNTEFCP